MSGETDEERQLRYNAMIQRINANNATNNGIPPSRMHSILHGASHMNSTQSIPDRMANTSQFYGGLHLPPRPAEGGMAGPSCAAPSMASTYAPSEASVFKMPVNTQKYETWSKNETVIELFNNAFRESDFHKFFVKLWVRYSNEIVRLADRHRRGLIRVNPECVEDQSSINNILIEVITSKYFSRTLRCNSVLSQSDALQFNPCESMPLQFLMDVSLSHLPVASHESRVFQSARHLMPGTNVNPSMVLDETTTSYQPQISAQNNNGTVQERPSPRLPTRAQNNNVTVQERPSARLPTKAPKNNDSVMHERTSSRSNMTGAQIFQPKTSQNPQIGGVNEQNISTAGAKGTTRSGRQVKTPNQFWKSLESKLTGPSVIDYSRKKNTPEASPEDLNETMSLRNKTIIKSTPLAKNKQNRVNSKPLALVNEEPEETHNQGSNKTKEPAKRNSLQKENKENTLMQDKRQKVSPSNKTKGPAKRKPLQKKNKENNLVQDKQQKVSPSNKTKGPAKRKPLQKENKENTLVQDKRQKVSPEGSSDGKKVRGRPKQKTEKKAPAKRKAKEAELTISKRKKINDLPSDTSSISSDSDDLFEAINFKKRLQTANQVLSPSNGMQSVKKAAATATSKETPPAKFLSQFMEPDIASSSTAKERPETHISHVVKRVTKVLEKKAPRKPTKNVRPVKNNSKENSIVGKVLDEVIHATYTTTTPVGNVGLKVFRGAEAISDQDSDLSEDDDDDDLI